MSIEIKEKNLSSFIVVGDRILIKPRLQNEKTKGGLYLPPTVREKEQILTGYVIKVGPGYPIPALEETEEWKNQSNDVKYVPLQVKEGDLAVYLHKSGYEIEINREKYIIVPQSAILLLHRDSGLFD